MKEVYLRKNMSSLSALEEIVENRVKTLKDLSEDTAKSEVMTESSFEAIDFDLVVKKYCQKFRVSNVKSNDALIILNEKNLLFIEFKNGNISDKNFKKEICLKITGSLLILNDIINSRLSSNRKHINYILVYNSDSLKKIGDTLAKKAGEKFKIERLDNYKKLFFHDVQVLDKAEFKSVAKSLEGGTYQF